MLVTLLLDDPTLPVIMSAVATIAKVSTIADEEQQRREEIWQRRIDPRSGGRPCVQCGNEYAYDLQFLFLKSAKALERTTYPCGGGIGDGTDDKSWVPALCCPECIDEIAKAKAGSGTIQNKLKIPPDDVVGILTR